MNIEYITFLSSCLYLSTLIAACGVAMLSIGIIRCAHVRNRWFQYTWMDVEVQNSVAALAFGLVFVTAGALLGIFFFHHLENALPLLVNK